jgi:ParB family chromosome partitioning protein
MIVTLTNVQQRGFSELSHSERAAVIKLTYDSLKKQGKRTDLTNSVDELVGSDGLLSVNLKKLPPKEALAEQFGLSSNNIAYYLRLGKLIPRLLERLDDDEFELTVAEKLTYLSVVDQYTVEKVYAVLGVKLTIGKAKTLVNIAKTGKLKANAVADILMERKTRKSSCRINIDVFERYLAGKEPEEIDDIIAQALELWEKSHS